MAYTIRTATNREGWKHTFTATEPAPTHCPSWKRHGAGYAELEITSHEDRAYLSIIATEAATGDEKRSPHRKQVFISLDEFEGRKLYEWMKERYEK